MNNFHEYMYYDSEVNELHIVVLDGEELVADIRYKGGAVTHRFISDYSIGDYVKQKEDEAISRVNTEFPGNLPDLCNADDSYVFQQINDVDSINMALGVEEEYESYTWSTTSTPDLFRDIEEIITISLQRLNQNYVLN